MPGKKKTNKKTFSFPAGCILWEMIVSARWTFGVSTTYIEGDPWQPRWGASLC
ncbi:hypothetical protein LY76DRAFT_587706 [Colletotrichum caudatum]|nr:hypothetical protein LY76DRAFT_587706 [Colletotrichum caudatum]